MTIGIYKLDFGISFYIGQSINIEKRYTTHLSALRLNKHCNSKLQDCFNKEGIPKLEIIEICDIDLLIESEQYYIKKFNAVNIGLNISEGITIFGYGEDNSQCNYSNQQIIEVFHYLVNTDLSSKQITELTEVSDAVIKSISSCTNHAWLQEKFPTEYSVLRNKLNKRTNSAIKMGIKYPKIVSPLGEILEVTNVQEFARKHNINNSSLHQVLTGKRNTCNKWKLV